tara:strand:+ start:17237 stop:17656 length:420 start_codon:yes stop_codon:yes gene_type:complete
MAIVRGEEGAIHFDDGTGSTALVAGTTSWNLDVTKELYEITAHSDKSRKYGGGLISATGSCEVQYQATSGDPLTELLKGCFKQEDDGTNAKFILFLDASSAKKFTFDAVISGGNFTSTVGELATATINFQMTGDITEDI